jgi:hypothetical protein
MTDELFLRFDVPHLPVFRLSSYAGLLSSSVFLSAAVFPCGAARVSAVAFLPRSFTTPLESHYSGRTSAAPR